MSFFLVALGLILFVALVVVHEFGHFIAARRNGVDVEEFGIGFPPRAKVMTKKKGTTYTLNWLPIGGFVKLKGEHDADKGEGSFGAASTWAKTKILLAGVGMNLIVAVIMLTGVAALGMPKLLCDQFTVPSDTKVVRQAENAGVVKIGYVDPGSPAQKAGFKVDDQLVSVNGTAIKCQEKLSPITKANAGMPVTVVTSRNGKENTQKIVLHDTSPYMGVSVYTAQKGIEARRSTWSAPVVAVAVTGQFTQATFKGLGMALKGLGSTLAGLVTFNKEARQSGQEQASSQVSGPIGIFEVIYQGSHLGFAFIMSIIAIISLTLAIMNILPIPALDGGRLFVMLLFRTARKKLLPRTEDLIHGIGFACLMLLFVLITFVDVKRFF